MFILFFTIVFIAELIVVAKLISVLKQADATVLEINSQVNETKPQISQGMTCAKEGVKVVTKGVGALATFVESKKKESFKIAVKLILSIVLLLLLKKFPNKKLLTVVDVLFALSNILKIA